MGSGNTKNVLEEGTIAGLKTVTGIGDPYENYYAAGYGKESDDAKTIDSAVDGIEKAAKDIEKLAEELANLAAKGANLVDWIINNPGLFVAGAVGVIIILEK